MDNKEITFLNPVGTSEVKLQEQIKLLNEKFGFSYELKAETTYAELQKMVGEAQTKAKEILAKDNKNDTKNEAANTGGKNAVYVWVKSPAYVDKDGEKRIAGGLYHIELAQYPRLKKMPSTVCEIIDGDISARKLGEVAKWFGVNVEKHDDDELLEMLIKEPALY